jgi:hypothetical protein
MTDKYSGLSLVWGETISPDVGIMPPSAGVGLWSYLTKRSWLRWSRREDMPSLAGKTVLVNLFHVLNATPISDIKGKYPDAIVVAMPDASLDMVLNHVVEWPTFWEELNQADALFCRTPADADVYCSLVRKPCWVLPSPAGPEEWFHALWCEKDPFVISLDHTFAPSNTAYNVAHLAEVQHYTGLPVKYLSPWPQTIRLAKAAGLEAEWIERIPFTEAARLTAKALLSVDIYASHSLGRHQIICGYVKTPCLTSEWTKPVPGVQMPVENPKMSGLTAKALIEDSTFYQMIVKQKLDAVKRYDFAPSLARLDQVLSELKEGHR